MGGIMVQGQTEQKDSKTLSQKQDGHSSIHLELQLHGQQGRRIMRSEAGQGKKQTLSEK
jgi:hypothetical protein